MTDDRRSYFDKARDWAMDVRLREARLRRIAWTVAGIATAVALFEAVALALLTPLKTVQPITLLVDRQTGFVQALDPLQPRRIGADAALTQSLLAQYVAMREQLDRATVAADYHRVALWSAGPARAQYLALMPASNPQSPLQRVASGITVTARVKSVSPLSDGVALVRFDTARQDRAGQATSSQPWISVVRYRYSDAAMTFEDRLINPLGFQVTSYRRDAEAPPLGAAPASTQPAAQVAQRYGYSPTATRQATIAPARTTVYVEGSGSRSLPRSQTPLGAPLSAYAPTPDRAALGGQP